VEEAISEIELELVSGTPEALFDLADTLLGGIAARLDQPNKAERGYRLLEKGKPAPRKLLSKPNPCPPGATAREAFARSLSGLVPPIAAALYQTLVSDHPEGPHQLRVGLRRLRTLLRLYKPVLDPALLAGLSTSARAMGQMVSPLRDADVLLPDLLEPLRVESPALADGLEHWHKALRQSVRDALRETRATAMPLALIRLTVLDTWAQPSEKRLDRPMLATVEPALETLWARIRSAGNQLAGLDDERQHEFRKYLKKLRYSLEFLPKNPNMKAFVSALKRLQEALGTLNDLAVLAGFQPPVAAADAALFARVRTARLEASRQQSDLALGRACRHWRLLSAVPVPWRLPA
jgi:CHAD domain-containing protein